MKARAFAASGVVLALLLGAGATVNSPYAAVWVADGAVGLSACAAGLALLAVVIPTALPKSRRPRIPSAWPLVGVCVVAGLFAVIVDSELSVSDAPKLVSAPLVASVVCVMAVYVLAAARFISVVDAVYDARARGADLDPAAILQGAPYAQLACVVAIAAFLVVAVILGVTGNTVACVGALLAAYGAFEWRRVLRRAAAAHDAKSTS